MTKNQRLALVWCQEHCSAVGIVRVSNSELALILGWSQQYTQKILSSLVRDGELVERQKGTGHRPTKYQVTSFSHNQNRASHNQGETSQQVHSHNQKRVGALSISKSITLFGLGESAQPNTRIYEENVFGNAARTLKPVSLGGGPFKRFRGHWDRPGKWTATDFVCYFSYVHKVRFGEAPSLNWPIECRSARTLLRRLGNKPDKLKIFIQVALGMCKRKPNGLRSFAYDYFYNQVIDAADDYIEHFRDEYDDEYVFPWLRLELTRRSTQVQEDYNRNMMRVYLGL
jgi:hypothetical protein